MNLSDIMIHIDESLDSPTRAAMEDRLRMREGVVAPRFNPGREHLLVVAFDPAKTRPPSSLTWSRPPAIPPCWSGHRRCFH